MALGNIDYCTKFVARHNIGSGSDVGTLKTPMRAWDVDMDLVSRMRPARVLTVFSVARPRPPKYDSHRGSTDVERPSKNGTQGHSMIPQLHVATLHILMCVYGTGMDMRYPVPEVALDSSLACMNADPSSGTLLRSRLGSSTTASVIKNVAAVN
ncbi:hypothetical protein C8Q74DRAFT_1221604 [Fomes fomentarius]|nr:hypothetical protein C8Q74DRAFT_1221604 [Fomes fomentarius]